MNFQQGFTLFVVIALIISLYKEWLNPALSFFLAVVVLLSFGILQVNDALKGLSNQQIIIIFLLMLITAGLRSIFGGNLFAGYFKHSLSPRNFLWRMMVLVSSISAFLNNTPIVAFMIPYVKEWAKRNNQPYSKFLIPLSYATISGGMITVIGTSTNLVLAGLLSEFQQPPLRFTDFLFLGLMVTVVTWTYLYFFGYKLLPENAPKESEIRQHLKEYIVETIVYPGSPLIGKTVRAAGLRNLEDLFLVEIIRNNHIISPVAPDELLEEGDYLFFSGNTQAIFNLVKNESGLKIPKQENFQSLGLFNFTEAVIPANSDLIGMQIKESDFRRKFNASIVALHRDGKRVSGKVGEMTLSGGDFLLLITGEDASHLVNEKDLYVLTNPQKMQTSQSTWIKVIGWLSVLVLLAGIVGIIPLFIGCLFILLAFISTGVLNLPEIKRQLDLNLLVIMVSSIAIGVAMINSGAATWLANQVQGGVGASGLVTVLAILFLSTTLLTALIANAAAVSIMFPIALAFTGLYPAASSAFYIAIAFAASGDFMTPFGYQTNLMVYGPGGYRFKDYLRVGTPLTIIYGVVCIIFISYYYKLT